MSRTLSSNAFPLTTLGVCTNYGPWNAVLSSAFTYASAGAAGNFRFVSPVSSNLTDVYAFFDGRTGSPTSTLTAQLRNATSTLGTPGTTLHASVTGVAPPAAANRWVRFTFGTPFACVARTPYHIVIADASGSAGNNVSVRGSLFSAIGTASPMGSSFSTTNGYTTAASLLSYDNGFPLVLKFADGTIFGSPYTSSTTNATNSRRRGVRLVLPGDAWFGGISASSLTGIDKVQVFDAATAPGGTPLLDESIAPAVAAGQLAVWNTPLLLKANLVYRVVLLPSSTTTSPGVWSIDDAASFADV